MSRIGCAALLAALVAAGLQAQTPVFRTGADMVLLDVLVTEGGRPVPGLEARDFEVRDGGVDQEIRVVGAEQVPVTAVLSRMTSAAASPRKRRPCCHVPSRLRARPRTRRIGLSSSRSTTGLPGARG